jgi:starch synthase
VRIACVIAEAYPFLKVGGLADVGGSLPRALARRGHDVDLVLPWSPGMGPGRRLLAVPVWLGNEVELMSVVHHGVHHGVAVFSLGSPS